MRRRRVRYEDSKMTVLDLISRLDQFVPNELKGEARIGYMQIEILHPGGNMEMRYQPEPQDESDSLFG